MRILGCRAPVFLGAFRIVTKSNYFLPDVRLSLRLLTCISVVPSVRISMKFNFGDFYENVHPLSHVRRFACEIRMCLLFLWAGIARSV